MQTIEAAWQAINSGAVLAILAYVIVNERRLSRLETIQSYLLGTKQNG